jgi:hypothetical protein
MVVAGVFPPFTRPTHITGIYCSICAIYCGAMLEVGISARLFQVSRADEGGRGWAKRKGRRSDPFPFELWIGLKRKGRKVQGLCGLATFGKGGNR